MSVKRLWWVVGGVAVVLLAGGFYVNAQFQNAYPELSPAGGRTFSGELTTEIPEVYELLHVALAISALSGSPEDEQFIAKDTPYYREVMRHFGPYREHPFIRRLEAALTEPRENGDLDAFLIPRYQALTYDFGAQGELVSNGHYTQPWLVVLASRYLPLFPFSLDRERRLASAFARDTGFRAFYAEHRPLYTSLTGLSRTLCDYRAMWRWLEARFPDRFESYRIVYSPLTGGLHNTFDVQTADGSIRQTLMWVSAPSFEGGVGQASVAARANACRVVFTEIDHNYVNPVTDLNLAALEEAMPDFRAWNTGEQGYGSTYETFNEYMTWSVFSLWAADTYPARDLESVISRQERFMEEVRGFPKFRAFNRELLRLYRAGGDRESVADLYPAMLGWLGATQSAER